MIGTNVPNAAQNRTRHSTSLSELRRRIADLEGRLPLETQFGPAPATAANPQGPDTLLPHTGRPGTCPAGGADKGDRMAFDLAAMNDLFQGQNGLKLGALHELVTTESRHAGVLSGFAFAVLARVLKERSGAVLIVQDQQACREAGTLHGPGLMAFGLDPSRLIVAQPRRVEDVLWCLEEGASCPALAAVLGEIQGSQRVVDLTATRRITLRAERSQMPVFLLRHAADQEPTAALTRWQVTPAGSKAPECLKDGPHPGLGAPRWTVELTKNRDGRPGHLTLEWNHETGKLAAPAHSLALDRRSSLRPDSAPSQNRITRFRPAG